MSWTDEKREQNWSKLNNDVIEIKTVLQEYVKSTNKMLEKHDHFINGNGKSGAEVRLDRLEQVQKQREHHGAIAWATGAGLIIKVVWDAITSFIKHG